MMGVKFFKKTTPLLVICVLGIILFVAKIINLFITDSNSGGLGTGVLGFMTVILVVLLAIDRYLVKRTTYRLLVILEIIFIIVAPLSYALINRKFLINVQTDKFYFIVVSDKNGKRKNDFAVNGFVDQSITVTNQDIIRLSSELFENPSTEVIPPWGGSFNAYLDTTINSETVKMQLYSNVNMKDLKDSIFNTVLRTLNFK